MNQQPERNNRTTGTNGQVRRPLTEEEKQRILAARAARQRAAEEAERESGGVRRTGGKRRRKSVRLNKGLIVFFVLIAVLIGIAVWQIIRNGKTPAPVETEPSPIETILPPETPEETEPEEPEEPVSLFDTVTVPNTAVAEGNLILVNNDHRYELGDGLTLKNVYADGSGAFKMAETGIDLAPEAFDALESLARGLAAETGCTDLMINSGHRTLAGQQAVIDSYLVSQGEDYVNAYVAKVGASEHHTGLACDLTFYTWEGYVIPISDHDCGGWLVNNAARYGFIRRYPEDKVNITGISFEPWHFRYIGVPHAAVANAWNDCLEEYIDDLKAYDPSEKMLYVAESGAMRDIPASGPLPTEPGWLIYCVAAADGESTELPVPAGEAYANRTVSGNNAGGFIVTVRVG